MSGNRTKSFGRSGSDRMGDAATMGARGHYPPARRQESRLEAVVLCQHPDLTDLFVQSVTVEVNAYSSRDLDPVDVEDMKALFYYAVLAKLAFVTRTPPRGIRTEGNVNVDVRRLDAVWALPGAYIPVLGSIGRIEGAHPVTYHPIITPNIIEQAALAFEEVPGGPTRLERVERVLLKLERNGLLIARAIPPTIEGNPDVMTSVMWDRELFFHREGVEGVLAAIAASVGGGPEFWNSSGDEAQAFVMTSSIGREAYKSTYLPEDVKLAVRELARDFTRER